MRIFQSFKASIRGLTVNKSRSILTILGIVIGITAIMLVMALGKGAENLILGQIQGIGSKTIVIAPGKQSANPGAAAQMIGDSLKEKDLVALRNKSNVPHLTKAEALNVGGATVSYGNESYRVSIYAGSGLLQSMYNIDLSSGRFIDDEDVTNRASVVVIGSKLRDELFGADDPVGQKIKIKERNFEIIGVIAKKGQVSFLNFDEAVILPYTTSQEYIFGYKYFHHIIVEVDSEANLKATEADVVRTMRESHNITDPNKDDFSAMTQEGAMSMVNNILGVITSFITAVAAISLVVGGVGIMNIMLVSVTERTREIGLRKAVGATRKDILWQFLIEAITLTAVGGFVGIILGTVLSILTAFIMSNVLNLNWQFAFPLNAVFLGMGVSTFIGLVFGIYPAREAASKDPIEALRYE